MKTLWSLALLPAMAAAQSMTATGAIEGKVSDATGAAMPGVRVSATHSGSAAVRAAETGDAGQFRLVGLSPGDYRLRFEREGFTTVEIGRASCRERVYVLV